VLAAFFVDMKLRRLDQLLSSLGYASRREAERFLWDHEVLIDGEPAERADQRVSPSSVLINGEPLLAPDGLLALYHKPLGLVCSRTEREGPTIYDALPEQWSMRNPQVNSIGRLDKDTSGILLLTDVGSINQRYTSPRSQIQKVYQVTVDQPLTPSLIQVFASGEIQLDGEPCLPAELKILSDLQAQLTLTEGRFHQVRRMFHTQGWEVTQLHRSHFGPYDLTDLPEGTWRLVDAAEA
jgi:16S rRNA pseudouridine516 synthase